MERSIDALFATRFRMALIAGVMAAAIGVPLAKVLYDVYISMTVSLIAAPEQFAEMYRGAMYLVGFASFFSGFFGAFFARRELRGHSEL